MKYFFPPYTEENIKKRFRELSILLHPDKGGNVKDFQEMKAERDLAENIGDISPDTQQNQFNKEVKRKIKMVRKKHSRVPRTKIVFNLDPDKLVKAFKKYFPK